MSSPLRGPNTHPQVLHVWPRAPISRWLESWLPSGKLTWLWKITIFNGKIHYKWQFSIALLVYQRVYITCPCVVCHSKGFSHSTFWSRKKNHPIHPGGRMELISVNLDEKHWKTPKSQNIPKLWTKLSPEPIEMFIALAHLVESVPAMVATAPRFNEDLWPLLM